MDHSTYFTKTFLPDVVNLDDTRLNLLDTRSTAAYNALKADGTIGEYITGMSRQGSWAHQMIIKPRVNGDFDADFLLHFKVVPGWEPKDYPNAVYNALHNHATYSKQTHGRKCRCVFLEYASSNEVGCHLDIVPFITLTDGRQVIVNRDTNTWEPAYGSTNPEAFTQWIKRKDELAGKQFRRVIRLVKYIRDFRGSFNGVKSVILTTLIGDLITENSARQPDRYKDVSTSLVNLIEDLDSWLQARQTRPQPLYNPNGDGTTFDHRWTDETYTNFRDRIHSIAAEIRTAYDEPDAEKSRKAWQKVFGDKFNPTIPASGSASASPYRAPAAALTSSTSSRSGRSG